MEGLTVKELKQLAIEYGIHLRGKLKKDIITEIETACHPSSHRQDSSNCHTLLIPTQDQIERQSIIEVANQLEYECKYNDTEECKEKLHKLNRQLARLSQSRENAVKGLRNMYENNIADMKVHLIKGDGNCLYNSIIYGLKKKYNINISVNGLKQIAFKYIRNCGSGTYQYQDPEGDMISLDTEMFIELMSLNKEYGNQEMINAISYGLGIQIVVYDNEHNIIIPSNDLCTRGCEVIYILFNGINHYDALEPSRTFYF